MSRSPRLSGRNLEGMSSARQSSSWRKVEGAAMPFFWRIGEPADRRVVNHARMLRTIHEGDWRAHGLSFLGEATVNPINAGIGRCRQRAVTSSRRQFPRCPGQRQVLSIGGVGV